MLPLLVNRFVRTCFTPNRLQDFPIWTQEKATNQHRIEFTLFLRASLTQLLLSDGSGTLGLTARDAGKGEITDNKVNKFARVNGTRRGHGTLKVFWKRAK